jgi:hypothetical protein
VTPLRDVPMRRSLLAWLVSLAGSGVMIATCLLLASGAVPETTEFGLLNAVLYTLMQLSFALVGAVLVSRVPGNRTGWLLWAGGALLAVAILGQVYPAWVMTRGGPTLTAVFRLPGGNRSRGSLCCSPR